MARVIVVDATLPEPGAIAEAAGVIRRGGLVAFPTETVYGLGADASSAAAVRQVFAAKSRPATDPLIVHVLDVAGLAGVSDDVPDVALALAEAFWPGPLTVVVPRGRAVPLEVTAGLDSVAVRSPDHPVARALIAAVGRPIAAPSANPFGRTSPTVAAHVQADLGDRVDLILDGGPTTVGIESTVVDCISDPPQVLRPGGITVEALAPWCPGGVVRDSAAESQAQTSPGSLSSHYATHAPLVLLIGDSHDVRHVLATAATALADGGLDPGLLVATEDTPHLAALQGKAHIEVVASIDDPAAVARRLYAALRAADCASNVILVRDFGGSFLALSVRDRLTRASNGRVVEVVTGDIDGAVAAVLVALG